MSGQLPTSFSDFMSGGGTATDEPVIPMTPAKPKPMPPAEGLSGLDTVMRIQPSAPDGMRDTAGQATIDRTARAAFQDAGKNLARQSGPSADAVRGPNESDIVEFENLMAAADKQVGGSSSDGKTVVIPADMLDAEGDYLGADEGEISKAGEIPLMLQAFPDRITLVEKENPENVVFTGPVSQGAIFGVGKDGDTFFVPSTINPDEAQVDTTEKKPIEAFRFNMSDLSTIFSDFYNQITSFEIMSPKKDSPGLDNAKATQRNKIPLQEPNVSKPVNPLSASRVNAAAMVGGNTPQQGSPTTNRRARPTGGLQQPRLR